MKQAPFTRRGIGLSLGATAAVGALALAGCGSADHANELRPAQTKIVSAYISDRAVSISPTRLGAGPITVVVTNQSGTPQSLTVDTAGDAAGTTRETAQIDPGDTANLQATVATGRYTVKASSDAIRAAVLKIGAPRPSAQNDLELP